MNLPSTPTAQPEQRLTTGLRKKKKNHDTHQYTQLETLRNVHHTIFVITANIPNSHALACVSDFRRCVFDMFSFLASKHRQPPEYRPHEDDGDEGQLRTAR